MLDAAVLAAPPLGDDPIPTDPALVATLVTTAGAVTTLTLADGCLSFKVGGARPDVFDRYQTIALLSALFGFVPAVSR